MQKKAPSKRNAAMRDITVKRVSKGAAVKEKPSFKIAAVSKDLPTIEPLEEDLQVQDDFNTEREQPMEELEEVELTDEEVAQEMEDEIMSAVDKVTHPIHAPVHGLHVPTPDDPVRPGFSQTNFSKTNNFEAMSHSQPQEPKEQVKVSFSKFVQLVNSHDCDNVIKNHPDDPVILSSDLLAELAGTHDEKEEKKVPLVFLVGLAIGVVITYILITK